MMNNIFGKIKNIAKIIGIVLLPIVGVPLLCIIGFIIAWHIDENKIFSEEKFDSAEWIALEKVYEPRYGKYVTNDKCDRGKMYDDLVDNYLHTDMHLSEIKELLGESYEKRQYSNFFGEKHCYVYNLGHCQWHPISTILLICVNELSKVNDIFLSDVNDNGKTVLIK